MASNQNTQQQQEAKEAARENLLANEPDILEGLLSAAAYSQDKESTYQVDVVRNKIPFFSFHIHPLLQEEYDKCRKANLTYKKVRGGVKQPEELNIVRYHSMLIYQATTEEDREKVWGNKTAWKNLNVLNGVDLIDKVLLAGEKDRVIDLIDKISGFSDGEEVETQEELAKN